MEKSNLPLPQKKRTIGEAIGSSVRDGSKPEKRMTVQFKHGLVRDSSGRVLKERPQFAGSYLKKRFGYSSKKTGVPFSLKGSKAVVTSLCAAGDFADACFPGFSENTEDSALQQESACVKRGSLSMKSKLLQLQERNRLILAKHQFPRTTSAPTQLNPDLTSAMLMTPLTLKVETTDDEIKTCNEQVVRLGESCSTSPIYHELDPIDGHVSSPEQHTYQSISEVREEMARLQAQMNFGNTMSACGEHNAANNRLKIAELSARQSQKRLYGTVQESEPKQNRSKRSIFSKFWLSRRNLLSSQEDATGDEKAVLTSITSLSEDEITTPPQTGEGLRNHPSGLGSCSLAQPSSSHSATSRKRPPNVTALCSWNAYSNHPLRTDQGSHKTDGCQGFYVPTDSSCYSNARGSCSNRGDGIGNSYDCYYGWKSDDEVESDAKMGPASQKTLLHSFAKRSDIKAGMKSKTKEEYFSSIEMANALTEYHWNVYQTGNVKKNETVGTLGSGRRLDDCLDSPSKGTEVFIALHQDQWVTSHFLPTVQLTPDQSKASTVLNMGLDTSDIYPHNVDTAFLHSRPATSSSSLFRGKMPHSPQFSSPSCGVRMAEMRAVRRKSESALLSEVSPNAIPRSPIPTHSKQEEMLHHSPTVESSPSCAQSEPNQVSRNMHTILEEDQLMEKNVASCHLEDFIPCGSDPETERSSTGLSRQSEESSCSQTEESTPNSSSAGSDSLNTKAECTIPEEMLSSDGSINDYEKKSGGDLINVASQTKQSTDSKTNGSRLKKPKPIKHCAAAAASSHTKPTNNTGDCSLMLNLPAEQYTCSSKARKSETATPNTPPLLFNSSRTIEREPKPLIRQAVIRQIESVSSATDVVGLELLESPRPQRTLQPTTRLKSGSCIPRTKNLFTNRTYSADDKPTRKICLRENESLRKRVDCQSQTKHLNHRSLEEATGLLTFSRSQSAEVTFKLREGKHLSCLYSDNSTSNSEMLNRCESTRNWTDQSQTPEVVVNCCPHDLECFDHKQNTQLSSSGEYHVSEISSLSSSLTSSNSSSSVFGITESESESPTTSSSTRDLQLELESPASSSSSSRGRTEVQSNASVTIPAQDSVSKDAESTATKQPQSRGKSQLLAPRTDATRCLERLERLRIETKQTKNEFHQKLRH